MCNKFSPVFRFSELKRTFVGGIKNNSYGHGQE